MRLPAGLRSALLLAVGIGFGAAAVIALNGAPERERPTPKASTARAIAPTIAERDPPAAAPAEPSAGPAMPRDVAPAPPAIAPLAAPPPVDQSVPAKPRIAIVIDDMGVDAKRSARAIALPGPMTLAFLPYARGLDGQIAAAQRVDKEILAHVPMQPNGDQDPGPSVLTVGLDAGEIRRRLEQDLDRFPQIAGINNHMGSRFTQDVAGMTVVLDVLKARGLYWFDSRTTANSVGPKLAEELGVPSIGRDVFLDDDPSPAAVRRALAHLEAIARRTGAAVAIGHPKDATLDALAQWLPRLQSKGFERVTLGALAAGPGATRTAMRGGPKPG